MVYKTVIKLKSIAQSVPCYFEILFWYANLVVIIFIIKYKQN